MTATQQKRLYWALGALLVAGLFAVLLSLALKENLQLYYTPADIHQGRAPVNHAIRLGGMVVPGSVHHEQETMKVVFTLTDGVDHVEVQYQGILPDLFKEGQGIVAQGLLTQDHQFMAQEVLAKHDENYMPKALKSTMKVADGS